MDLSANNYLSIGLLFLATIISIKLISALLTPSSGKKRLPPTVKTLPVIGGLLRFMKGPIIMIREEYQKLGSVFTVSVVNRKITFFVGPEVSSHFFKAPEADLSQQEVYQFNVPTFGPGVVFDVDYSVRQEQFRFFTEALRVNKLKSYVDQMIVETEDIAEHLTTVHLSRCERGKRCLYEGSTPPGGFPNTWNGAAYCTSELIIQKNGEVHTWDRGYDEEGNQVWGPRSSPYEFKTAPASSRDELYSPLNFSTPLMLENKIEGSFVLSE